MNIQKITNKIKYEDIFNSLNSKYGLNILPDYFLENIYFIKNDIKDIIKQELDKLIETADIHLMYFDYLKNLNKFKAYMNKIYFCSKMGAFVYFCNLYEQYISYKWTCVQYTSADDLNKCINNLKTDLINQKNKVIDFINAYYFLNLGYSKTYCNYLYLPVYISKDKTSVGTIHITDKLINKDLDIYKNNNIELNYLLNDIIKNLDKTYLQMPFINIKKEIEEKEFYKEYENGTKLGYIMQ